MLRIVLATALVLCGVSPALADGPDPVELAREDLAARLQLPMDQISVVSQAEVAWPSGALGCPRPGMSYKQVLVNGSRLVLQAGGKRYSYHSGGGRDYFFCPVPDADTASPDHPDS